MSRKSYTDELAEWVKRREATRPRQDKSLVAFLAMKPDVTAAIDAGYSLKTIWEHLHETGRIVYRYETFLKHVRRHIKRAKPPADPRVMEPKGGEPASATPAAKKGPRPVGGFSYDPNPNKEDLL